MVNFNMFLPRNHCFKIGKIYRFEPNRQNKHFYCLLTKFGSLNHIASIETIGLVLLLSAFLRGPGKISERWSLDENYFKLTVALEFGLSFTRKKSRHPNSYTTHMSLNT